MWSKLKLTGIYKELERRRVSSQNAASLIGLIDSSFDDIAAYLGDVRRYFHHFTDHCVTHSVRVIDNIGQFLTPGQVSELEDVELYLLVAAALVHDIGLIVSENEVRSLANDQNFRHSREKWLATLNCPMPTDWQLHGVERLFVAEYIRRIHGTRCRFYFDEQAAPCRALVGSNAKLARWLGKIGEGHTLPFDEVSNEANYPHKVDLDCGHANVQFIVLCLRLGDLLDMSSRRTASFMRELSEPLPFASGSHWDQYEQIEVCNLAPEKTVVIGGTCKSQDAERLLREWVEWLRTESEKSVTAMNCCPERYRLHIGKIQYNVQPQRDRSGKPLYEFREYRFNLDEEEVFKRLFGQRLYGRVDAALRELIQNAVDATRVRLALYCSETSDWFSMESQAKQARYADEYEKRKRTLPITLEVEKRTDTSSSRDEVWLCIEDQGVGMSRDVIEGFLLKVGRSRWRHDTNLDGLAINTIGEFGVGFLSTFMISDRTVIETQSCLPDEDGIRATIYSWKGYLATQPFNRKSPGTRVSMLIKPELVAQITGSLVESLQHWCPFLEFPLVVVESGTRTAKIEVVRPGKRAGGRVCFQLVDSPSLATIDRRPRIQDKATSPVSQDGLLVPDIPPPILEIPEQRILRLRDLRIDLRGVDRVRLDLSRNLSEGGADVLWSGLVPKIWGGIAANCLEHEHGYSALRELLQAEFYRSVGTTCLTLDCHGRMTSREVSDWGEIGDVQFAAVNEGLHSRDLNPDLLSVLVPGIPRSSEIDNEMGYGAVQQDYYSESEDEMNDQFGAESDSTGPDSEEDSDMSERRRVALAWATRLESSRFAPSLAVFREYAKCFTSNYGYVRPGREYSIFCRKKCEDAISLDRLGFILLADDCVAVRSPCDGKWHFALCEEFDPDFQMKDRQSMSACEYAMQALFYYWRPTEHVWADVWPMKRRLETLSNKISTLLDAENVQSDSERSRDPEDDDEDFDFKYEEERARRETFEFRTLVAPNVDAKVLAEALAPWDVQRGRVYYH